MDYNELYQLWSANVTDPALKKELDSIKGDNDAIQDRFYKDLEFGTAGLRGVIGAGTNRMNIYTVGRATQGFSDYINANFENASVAIGYDSRNNSDLFSRTAAQVFAANGIKVWLYPELAPTPMLSFAVRYYHCAGGVVVTASHNPAEYNGYKAYGPDGCQLSGEASALVTEAVETSTPPSPTAESSTSAATTTSPIMRMSWRSLSTATLSGAPTSRSSIPPFTARAISLSARCCAASALRA